MRTVPYCFSQITSIPGKPGARISQKERTAPPSETLKLVGRSTVLLVDPEPSQLSKRLVQNLASEFDIVFAVPAKAVEAATRAQAAVVLLIQREPGFSAARLQARIRGSAESAVLPRFIQVADYIDVNTLAQTIGQIARTDEPIPLWDERLLIALVREAARRYQSHLRQLVAHHQTDQMLRERENNYRAIIDHAPVGILVFGPGGGCVEANRAACRALGSTFELLLQRQASDLLAHPRECESLLSLAAEQSWTGQVLLLPHEGEPLPMRACAQRLPDGRLEVVLLDALGVDSPSP
jgi:PAS domain S-box-containing protein